MSFVTVPNVELLSVGTWHLMSGTTTFTEEDLAAAVAAMDDPAVHSPRLKIGHTSDWGDGEPCFGRACNLRLSDDKQTVLCDYEGVPEWLANLLPTAWPSRSIEGYRDATTATGKTHGLVIDAVALLGVVAPGVSVLEDLQQLYGDEIPTGVEVTAGTPVLAAHEPRPVRASIDIEDVRRDYYESLSTEDYWSYWIRAVQLEPDQLIVTNESDGRLYRVPFEVSGSDVTFGDPVEVRIEYVDVGTVNAAGGARTVAAFDSRAQSRPEANEQENSMTDQELRESLGLPTDASDEDVRAKLAELRAPTPEGGEGGSTEVTDEDGETTADDREPALTAGTEVIDSESLNQLKAQAARGEEARRQQETEARERDLDAAVKAGKIPPSRREHWASLYKQDPEGTKSTLASLAEGIVPVAEAEVDTAITAGGQSEAYPSGWLPEVEARQSGATPQIMQEA